MGVTLLLENISSKHRLQHSDPFLLLVCSRHNNGLLRCVHLVAQARTAGSNSASRGQPSLQELLLVLIAELHLLEHALRQARLGQAADRAWYAVQRRVRYRPHRVKRATSGYRRRRWHHSPTEELDGAGQTRSDSLRDRPRLLLRPPRRHEIHAPQPGYDQ